MDHVRVPADPAYSLVDVPCLSDLSYPDVEFEAYPTQRGWDLETLLAGDFSQTPPTEAAIFLQEWLYFALLRTVLGEVFQRHSYVEPHTNFPHGRITTKCLEAHVQQRLTALSGMLQDQPDKVRDVFAKIEICLIRLSRFCQLADRRGMDWPLPPEVDLSLRIIGVYLAMEFYGGLVLPEVLTSTLPLLRFGGGPLLRSRMLALGWCPSDMSMVFEQFSTSSAYYASLLKRPAATGDHSTCTGQKCLAFQLNEDTYETKHVTERCTCSSLGPNVQDLIGIIQSGRTPVLTIVRAEKSGDLSIQVAPLKSGRRYICFSHVCKCSLFLECLCHALHFHHHIIFALDKLTLAHRV
jgi:hypothetical protein